MSLFRRQVTIFSLSSGSAGNATYVTDGHAGVLVDCGISTKKTLESMRSFGLEGAPLDAILVTHEHSDHIGAAGVLSRTLRKSGKVVPFYMTPNTYECANPKSRPDAYEAIRPGEAFRVRHFLVHPLPIPHDAGDPVAYQLEIGDACVAVVTDLGQPTRLIEESIRKCDALVLEFNHDEQLLMDGSYPYALKQRIRSNKGHLSNRQAQELLLKGYSPRLKHLLLGHLSEENNRPEKAEKAAQKVLDQHAADTHLYLTSQRTPIAPVTIETHHW